MISLSLHNLIYFIFKGTAVFMNKERIHISRFIARLNLNVIKFVFKQPKLSDITNLFLLPFTPEVWFALIALMILLMLSFYLSWKWFKIKSKINSIKTNQNHEISDSFDVVIAAICQQASSVIPQDIIGTIIKFVTYLSYFILFVCYSANIVSLLQSPSHKIKTLEDMYKSSFEFSKVFYMQPYYEVAKIRFSHLLLLIINSLNFLFSHLLQDILNFNKQFTTSEE